VPDFDAIRAATRTMQALLRREITESSEPGLASVPIDLRSPRELNDATEDAVQAVSLWMYRVIRNGFILNNPPERIAPGQTRRHPLPVNLHYLITPLATTSDDEQLLLGKVLQVFNDFPTLRGDLLEDSLEGLTVELRVSLEPLDLEALTRVWEALKEPYQLSVSYMVQVVDIDSSRAPAFGPPVGLRETEYLQIRSTS
jgi:hypothetical protein